MAQRTNSLLAVFGALLALAVNAPSISAEGPTEGTAVEQGIVEPLADADHFDATTISAALFTTCAISLDHVFCWGGNDEEKLGDGESPPVPDQSIPRGVALPGINLVASTESGVLAASDVTVGEENVCATSDGSAYCWGYHSWYGLGVSGWGACYPYTDCRSINFPTAPTTRPELATPFTNTGISRAVAGDYNSCALQEGVAFCWGDNYDLGSASLATPIPVAEPSNGFTNTAVTSIDVSYYHACLVEGGSVYCWGQNDKGQLGDGTTTNSDTPVKVSVNTDEGFTNTNVAAVIVTYKSTCAIEAGSVYCWGSNGAGDLADGVGPPPAVGGISYSTLPLKVHDGPSFVNSNVSALSTDSYDSQICALREGVMYCWGYLAYDLDESGTAVPRKVKTGTDGFTNTAVTEMAVGYEHACAIELGLVYCWGENYLGQLGDGTIATRATPTKVIGRQDRRALTTEVVGSGSIDSTFDRLDCTGTCTNDVLAGTQITLEATPGSGQQFDGWSGACAGTDECVVEMTEARTVTATFSDVPAAEVDITLVVIGDGSLVLGDTTCESTCTVSVDSGSTQTITATASDGYEFTTWGGACSGTTACSVTPTASQVVTGKFSEIATDTENDTPTSGSDADTAAPATSASLTVVVFGEGVVSVGDTECSSTCTIEVDIDSVQTLQTAPGEGYVFESWGGACSSRDVCEITMTSDTAVTARFLAATLPATGSSLPFGMFAVLLASIGALAALLTGRRTASSASR